MSGVEKTQGTKQRAFTPAESKSPPGNSFTRSFAGAGNSSETKKDSAKTYSSFTEAAEKEKNIKISENGSVTLSQVKGLHIGKELTFTSLPRELKKVATKEKKLRPETKVSVTISESKNIHFGSTTNFTPSPAAKKP